VKAASGPDGETTELARAKDKTLFVELERRSDALPNAVNPAGTVVVGKFSDVGGFFWTPTTGAIDLGGGFATGVSADGNVFEDESAWVWTAKGGVECLPPPRPGQAPESGLSSQLRHPRGGDERRGPRDRRRQTANSGAPLSRP